MKVLKICMNTWEFESRDHRELSVCKDLGTDVLVLAKGDTEDRGRLDQVSGFPVHRYTTRPYKNLPTSINKVLAFFQWVKYARTLDADIISGHDIGGWTIGWLVRVLSKKKRILLVYDSHEFELGRNISRSKFHIALIKIWERIVLNQSAFTIVVNDSIADELVRIYRLKERPVVVRNIPKAWNVDESVCKNVRRELINIVGDGVILIYHGLISENRGIEQLLVAIKGMPKVKLLIIGNYQSETYKKQIEELIKPVQHQVITKAAVPHDELWKYIGAADICVAPIIPKHKSYYFALPNKMFEAIQTKTPLLVSDLPEMSRIISKYNIGEAMNPQDPIDVQVKIQKLWGRGKEYYERNLEKAAEELSWDKEKKILLSAYKIAIDELRE